MRPIMETIGFEVSNTADWRRMKAEQFPGDDRNLKAAKELDQLAEEVEKLEGSEVHQRIDAMSDRACNTPRFSWERLNDSVSAALRSYGFSGGCGNGQEFLGWYCEEIEDLIRRETEDDDDENIPAPDLAQQVENDPVVKAAREAYETIRDKAYAEARKRL